MVLLWSSQPISTEAWFSRDVFDDVYHDRVILYVTQIRPKQQNIGIR